MQNTHAFEITIDAILSVFVHIRIWLRSCTMWFHHAFGYGCTIVPIFASTMRKTTMNIQQQWQQEQLWLQCGNDHRRKWLLMKNSRWRLSKTRINMHRLLNLIEYLWWIFFLFQLIFNYWLSSPVQVILLFSTKSFFYIIVK